MQHWACNAITVLDLHFLPKTDESVDILEDAQLILTLSTDGGYFRIGIEEAE